MGEFRFRTTTRPLRRVRRPAGFQFGHLRAMRDAWRLNSSPTSGAGRRAPGRGAAGCSCVLGTVSDAADGLTTRPIGVAHTRRSGGHRRRPSRTFHRCPGAPSTLRHMLERRGRAVLRLRAVRRNRIEAAYASAKTSAQARKPHWPGPHDGKHLAVKERRSCLPAMRALPTRSAKFCPSARQWAR